MRTFYGCTPIMAYYIFTMKDEIKFNIKICKLIKLPNVARNSLGWGIVLTDYYHTLYHKSSFFSVLLFFICSYTEGRNYL
jgi:hypothetical protein